MRKISTHRQNYNNEHLEIAKQHAISKGGQCLSDTYINGSQYMEWKCGNPEHKPWMTTYKKVVAKNGTWCPACKRKPKSRSLSSAERLELSKQLAISKGGQCLSETHNKATDKLTWKCGNPEHKPWTAIFSSVYDLKSWCPECGEIIRIKNQSNKNGLEIARQYAESRGGQCLSTEYIKARSNLTWKCCNPNHQPWESWFDTTVIKQRWCPDCGTEKYLTEGRVRMFLETYLGFSLHKTKPSWNINPWTNQLLELDGYNEFYKIAFEHDGEHHFEVTRKNSPKTLTYQKFKDYQKKKNCLINGVTLINIPILDKHSRYDFDILLKHVIKCCRPHGLLLTYTKTQLKEMREEFYTQENNNEHNYTQENIMDTNKYKSRSIHIEHIHKAHKFGMTMNEYIAHLVSLAETHTTSEQKLQLERLNALEGTVSALAKALKDQKFQSDNQTKKIDELLQIQEQNNKNMEKLLKAFGADIEFIQALKELTK